MQQADGDISHMQFRVGILWGSNGIGDVAKKGCPVSMALTGVDIRLQARLVKLAA
jgi:hypothetical protein